MSLFGKVVEAYKLGYRNGIESYDSLADRVNFTVPSYFGFLERLSHEIGFDIAYGSLMHGNFHKKNENRE